MSRNDSSTSFEVQVHRSQIADCRSTNKARSRMQTYAHVAHGRHVTRHRRSHRHRLAGAPVIVVLTVALFVVMAGPASADTSSASTATPQATASVGVPDNSSTTSTTATGGAVPAPTIKAPAGESTTTTTKPNHALVGHSGAGLNGAGSSFAAPAIETFASVVQSAPYSININYSSTSSGDGRYEFTNGTTDFAVSDIAYGLGAQDATPPTFPYIYVPVTAGGIAFMYNIPGLSKNLQLNSYDVCAILTGAITNWNDPHITSANPGVSLPNLAIRPVTESDPAGTNYVLEEWCIAEQPALWAAFANYISHQAGNNVPISATSPESEWPALPNGLSAASTAAVASDVVDNAGGIGPVQQQYAADVGFGKGNPAQGVTAVQNASGDFTLPTPVDVASALAYATQLPNGTHQLNFGGAGPHVYNPSTYSYLLTPTKGWSCAKGTTMSKFVNYALTLGQQKSPSFFYASLGLSLERYGINAVIQDVPCAVAVTSAEQSGYACGDLTPQEVAAGQTVPTCGVTNATAPLPPGSGVNGVGGAGGGAGSAAGGAGGAGGRRRRRRRRLGCQRSGSICLSLGFDTARVHRWRPSPRGGDRARPACRRLVHPAAAAEKAPTGASRSWIGRTEMNRRHLRGVVGLLSLAALVGCSTVAAGTVSSSAVGAATPANTLSGEGGSFLSPVVNRLLVDDKGHLEGLFGGYFTNDFNANSDFVGSAPNSFAADFAVTERPLTAAEASTAKADGRGFAYVPFAATPVALGTIVTNTSYTGQPTIPIQDFCPHIEMTVQDLAAVWGIDQREPGQFVGRPALHLFERAADRGSGDRPGGQRRRHHVQLRADGLPRQRSDRQGVLPGRSQQCLHRKERVDHRRHSE